MGLRKYSGLDLIRFRKFANELPEMGNLELIKKYKEKYPELTPKEKLVNLAVGLGINELHRSLTGTDLPPDSGWDKPETSDEALHIGSVVESKPNEKAALKHAVEAIYFADNSDYLSGLYGVVRSLTGLDEPSEEDIKKLFKELNPE